MRSCSTSTAAARTTATRPTTSRPPARDVEPGDIVLIYSGYADADQTRRMRQTWLTAGAAEWLVERGAHAVGVEPCTPDPLYAGMYELGWLEKDTPNPPAWPAHTTLLRNDVYIIEGLTNLDRIRGQRVRFAALPALVPGLSGFPVRAVAWLGPRPRRLTGPRLDVRRRRGESPPACDHPRQPWRSQNGARPDLVRRRGRVRPSPSRPRSGSATGSSSRGRAA